MNKYRTHNCSELNKDNNGQEIVLSGWVNKKRDHGNLLFIDLRDNYGMTQCIIDKSNENFKLEDLKSRTKNCLLAKIENPDDELMFALILKNLSDRQITLDKKLIDFIIKRIDRSYGKIFEFIYKIDKISLKKKKSIDFKIINEALEK